MRPGAGYERMGASPMEAYRGAAQRRIKPIPPVKPLPPLAVSMTPGMAPGAPGLSSRISPGTVPMKKGMR